MSTENHNCCRLLWRKGFELSLCGKRATMQHRGRWFCDIHDPVKRKARMGAKRAEREAKWKARDEERKAMQEALERANGTCEWGEEAVRQWHSDCSFTCRIDGDGYNFCPHCGKKIVFVKYTQEGDKE